MRVLNEQVPALPPEVAPFDVSAVLAKAMAKAPEDRFQTARDLAFALEGATTGGRPTTSEVTALPRAMRTRPGWLAAAALLPVAAAAFWLIQWSPQHWWLWVWAFMAVFSIFLMFLSPYVIEPLFNKFEPVREEGLEEEIAAMMAKAGLTVGRVMQMDASRRSRHSNAYFTGIGRVKRIVLFDTLLKQMTHAEIVAVLAHEIGHWKLRHILKRLVVVELLMLGGAWLAFHLLQWPGLPGVLGLDSASLPARMVILGFIASLVMFPVTPLSAWLSRRDENAADCFAGSITGRPAALATALESRDRWSPAVARRPARRSTARSVRDTRAAPRR